MNPSIVINSVLAHLWQSTLFAGLVWLLTAALLRKDRPQVRYSLWLTASLKFLIPLAALTWIGSLFGWSRTVRQTAPAVYTMVDQVTQSVGAPIMRPRLAPAVLQHGDYWPALLVIAWATGVVVVAIRWWLSWRRVQSSVAGAAPLFTVDGTSVYSSPTLRERGLEPGVFGLFRPMLLVPEGITDRLTAAEFAAVMAHECCHIRRRDNLAAALHMMIEAIFWFHPLVWWIGKRLIVERERACDEEVVRGGADPGDYAQGILNICKFYAESPLQCIPGVTGSNLRQRIEAIMTRPITPPLNFTKKLVLAISGLVIVAVPIFLGQSNAPITNTQVGNSFTGMATSAEKKFDVASIKENTSGSENWRLGVPNRGNERIDNLELRKIIASSFRIQDKIVFGPSWMDTVRYDVEAKGPDPNATNPEVWEMMRSLLAERFQLKYHIESREMPAYVLTIAKGGHKLGNPEKGRCAGKAGPPVCGGIFFHPFGMEIVNMPVGGLTGGVARMLQDRPIVDQTGLTERYDVKILWMPDSAKPEDLANVPKEERPEDISIFEAFEKYAGLTLEPKKTGVQVLVVDNISRPSPN